MILEIGDIVERSDIKNPPRFVIIDIRGPWTFARRIGKGGTPGVITFPSRHYLRKVG
jgi:hypothetical protein